MDQAYRGLGCRFQKHIDNACHSLDFADAKSYGGTVILRDSILGREEVQLLGRIIDKNLHHDAR
jgi:hypothetical protein